MPSIFEQKQTALKTIGMGIIDKVLLPFVDDPLLKPSLNKIIKDGQGSYNVSHLPLDIQYSGELFSGEEKILSWQLTKNNDLILDVYCSEQVNLWDSFNFKNLFINSRGPVYLGGKINCLQSFIIKAQSLAFSQAIICEQSVIADAENGMVLLAPIACKSCFVRSGAIYQFEQLKTQEQTDLTCTIYTSSLDSELVSPTLRLVTESAFFAGQVNIDKKCFILAGRITLGQLDCKNDILFAGEIHIRSDYLEGLGATQIVINAKEKNSIIKVNKRLQIDSNVFLSVDNVIFNFDGATLKGVFQCTKTQLSFNDISNSGSLYFKHGNLVINQSYTSDNGGVLELDQTHALIQEMCCIDGTTIYHKSMIVGKKQFILSGSLRIADDSTICLADELQICEKSSFFIDKSSLEAGKEIGIRGGCEINQSQIKAPLLTYETEEIKAEGFSFSSSEQLTLSGKLDLIKGSIDAFDLVISGQINLDEARIWCDYMQLTTDNGHVNNLNLQTSHLKIVGGIKPEDVQFTNSDLTVEYFTSKNHLTLDFTSLYLIGSGQTIQSLGKGVVLESSNIVSLKPIIQAKDSKLVLNKHSSLSAPELLVQGEVSSDFAVIFSERLNQIQGAFTAKHTNLYLNEQFTAIQSDVVIEDNSKCIVPTIHFLGNTQAALNNNSILLAQNSVTVDKLSINDSGLVTPKMKVHGATQISHSLLTVEELHIYNAFDVSNQSQISAEALISVAKESLITVNESRIQAHSMNVSGQVTLSDAQLKVDEKLRVKREGDLVLEPGSIIMSEYLAVMGQMHVTQKHVFEDECAEKVQSVPAQLRINDKFIITSKAKLDGNAPLVAEVGEFLNFGSINLSSSLTAKGALLYNNGNFEVDTIHLGFDDAVVNTGMLAANNMTLHSNFINPFGRVYVKESMNCSGFYGFNLGLICANNYSNNTLLSLDCGLVLPNLSADLKYIFSAGNLLSAGRTIVSTMAPGYSNLINFACMVPSGIQAASSFYDLCKDKNIDDLKNMRRHEWMPLVGQLYSLGMLGFNAATTGYHAGVEFKNLGVKGLFSGFAAPKWSDIGLKTATIFAGSYRNTSLIHLNMGLSFAGSTSHSSLLHVNTGIEASFISHSVNTHWLYNEGISTGTESSFTASNIVNNGTLSGAASLFVSADTFTNKEDAILSGHNATVKVGSMKQDGTMRLDEGVLHVDDLDNTGVTSLEKMVLEVGHVAQNNTLILDACGGELKHFETQKSATTSIQNSVLKGDSFEDKGQLDLKNVSLDYSERFEVDKEAKVHSSNVTIKTASFKNEGDWQYEDALIVHAQKAAISKDAIMHGQKTDESDLFVEKEKKQEESEQDKPSEAKDEKTFNPKHVFILNADEGLIDGQLSGGDYTQIRGVQPEKVEGATEEPDVKKSQKISFGDNAQVDLRYGSLQTDAMDNTGQVHLDSFSLDIGRLSQQGLLNIEKSSGTITQLSDTKNANTVISQSALKGDCATFEGHLDASNSSFNYQTRFEMQDSSKAHTNNVSITTQTFREAGELQFEHYLEVNADKAVIETGAVIWGEKTSEDKLFQEKSKDPAEPPSTDDKPTEEKKEPEKDFKPQHVLSINTRTLKIDGELSGGDYTTINGKAIASKESPEVPKETSESKCESIEIGNTAKIDLQYGNITSERLQVDGNINLSSFDLKIDHTNTSKNGHLELSKTKLTGAELVNAGECKFSDTSVEMSGRIILENSAQEQLTNVSFKTTQFIDHSHMSEQGQVSILTDSYVHDGKIVAPKSVQEGTPTNLLYVESKTAQLNGEAAHDSAIYNIENFNDAENLLRGDGQYSKYQFFTSLGMETKKDIHLTGKINRECGLHVKGKSVTVNTNYSTEQDLTFISSEGNIALSGQLHGGNVYGKSEKGITTDASINANTLIHLEAKEGFENNGGTLNSDQVAVKAQFIKNYKGVINGRSDVYLDATRGNIENHGGMIRGGKYTQLTATGDVKNLCNVSSHWNGFDWVNDYDGGLIAGGTGENTKDVGLYIKAEGKVISDASDFVSDGINYIEGDKGLEFGARQQTYVANQWTTKKWYGKKETHTEVTTQVKGSTVHSAKGVNILRTEHGGLESVATQFSSPGGTQMYSRDAVNLYNIKAGSRTYDSKSTLWGLNKSQHYEYHEEVTPTLFIDNGLTRIVSSEGCVDARGALFLGAGDLEIEAKHRIKLGCDILDNTVIDKKQSVGISMPGVQAYNTLKEGGNWIDAATAEDATVAKMNRLAHSGNTTEVLANAANLGVNLYNTTNSVMRGLGNDTLSKEMLSRYGLGGAEGFSPTLTLSMTKTKTTSNYQTLGAGGVDRGGNITLKAGDGVDLENGVRVHAGGKIDIDAPELVERNATLHSTFEQKTQTASLNVNASGIQGASYSESRTRAEATNHVNAELSAGDNIRLHHGDGAMKSVILDGGNISCKTLDADIEHLTIISKQDTSESATSSFGASTNGQVSFYEGNSRSKLTNQNSGIHVEEGINNNGHTVHVGEAYMEGGKITTNGQNNIVIDKLTTVELQDESHTSGFGISVNLNDLGRLAGQKSTNQTGEQAIAVAELTYDHVNYQATQTAVIHGEQGTNIVIGQLDGKLHTTSADGCTITKNETMHLVLDIPITNKSYLESASQNFKAGTEKLNTLFGRDVPLDVMQEKGIDEIVELEKVKEIEDVFSDEDFSGFDDAFGLDEYEGFEDEIDISIQDLDDLNDLQFEKEVIEKERNDNQDDRLTLEQQKEEATEALVKVKKAADAYKDDPTKKNADKYREAKKQAVALIKEYVAMAMGTYPAKEFTKRYTVIVNLIFNLCGASIDKKEDVIREALIQSGSDFVLAKVLTDIGKFGGESLGTGIGVGLVVFSALDALFYDQKRVEKMLNSGLDDLNESDNLRREGKYFDSFNMQLAASEKIAMSSRAQAGHIALEFINTAFKQGIESLSNMSSSLADFYIPSKYEENNRFFKSNRNEFSENHKEQRQAVRNIE